MRIRFEKWSGAGTDFVLLEGLPRGKSAAALARALCDRREGVGADGLLVMTRHNGRPRVDYRNADGSVAFCGNGSRCAALWAARHYKGLGSNFLLETSRGTLVVRLTAPGRAEVAMPEPKGLVTGLKTAALKRNWNVHYVDTGVPHAVLFVSNVSTAMVGELGRALRFHKAFGKPGANVDFIQIKNGIIHLRTYERGVEAETLACGTGVVAAAYVARSLGRVTEPVRVKVKGGAVLRVTFTNGARLEGPGRLVHHGEITL